MDKVRKGCVAVFGYGEREPVWRAVKSPRLKDVVVLCAQCDRPAVYIDHLFPYHMDYCRCEQHCTEGQIAKNKRQAQNCAAAQFIGHPAIP